MNEQAMDDVEDEPAVFYHRRQADKPVSTMTPIEKEYLEMRWNEAKTVMELVQLSRLTLLGHAHMVKHGQDATEYAEFSRKCIERAHELMAKGVAA